MVRSVFICGLLLAGCKRAPTPEAGGTAPSTSTPEPDVTAPALPPESDQRVQFEQGLAGLIRQSGADWSTDVALFDVSTGQAEPWVPLPDESADSVRDMLIDSDGYRFNMSARCRPFPRAAVRVSHRPDGAESASTAVFFVAGPNCPKVRVRWGEGDWARDQWGPELEDAATGQLLLDYDKGMSEKLFEQLGAALTFPEPG